MDVEMQGIFDRAHELMKELTAEYAACAKQKVVSERAKDLFHELFVKIRSALDFSMNRIFDKYSTLRGAKRKTTKNCVYFPICGNKQSFDHHLHQLGLSHLGSSYSDLYNKLKQCQPFSSKRKDLLLLRELSNLGKHVRLAAQTVQHQKAKRLTRPNGSVLMFTEGVYGLDKNGNRIDLADGGAAEDVVLATFSVDHKTAGVVDMPDCLCLGFCLNTRRYVQDLLVLVGD